MTAAAHNPTARKLLLTALELYARQGLHGVSLRAIGSAAGSKNSAAMHYHFNDKAGVIGALLGFIREHMQLIAAELALASRLRQSDDLEEVIKLGLRPIAELPVRYEWGANALQFLSRMVTDANRELGEVINAEIQGFYQLADREIARLLPELDPETRQLRLLFMGVNVFHGFAEVRILQNSPLGNLGELKGEALLDHFVRYMAAGLRG